VLYPEASTGHDTALRWKTYGVRRSEKELLLRFILEGLQDRGCRIVSASDPGRAPFYIVFETPAGSREALLAYAFNANSVVTNERPADEHRFQIKYGGNLKGILEVTIDSNAVITTIFLGIDLERMIFVAADPFMNAPSPMSRSVEFKSWHVDEVQARGWFAWERDRRRPRTKTRPTADVDEDTRIQILVGGKREHIFDLVVFERLARGLDPGERHLLADRLLDQQGAKSAAGAGHKLLEELGLPSDVLFDLIEGAARLKMAVRGWVAEQHLENYLKSIEGVSDCRRLNEEGQPDLALRWKGSAPFLVECKNVLRKTAKDGSARIDFQKTRAAKGNPCSRYYSSLNFPVLAACLHSVTEQWDFCFALTSDLPAHKSCLGKISNSITVQQPVFLDDPKAIFDKYV
jgi:hypothetical protein